MINIEEIEYTIQTLDPTPISVLINFILFSIKISGIENNSTNNILSTSKRTSKYWNEESSDNRVGEIKINI